MINYSKYKLDWLVVLPLILMAIISIITIRSSINFNADAYTLANKQLMWYIIGIFIIFTIMTIGNDLIYRYHWVIYIICNLALLGLLFFGEPINNARCWYSIPGVGTLQPSEFVKISLIITIANVLKKHHNLFPTPTHLQEFKLLFKVGLILLIPSILTFLQPDTGAVLIYLLITIVMLFTFGIRYKWFIILITLILIATGTLIYFYTNNQVEFIKIFGTSFFLRIDRLLDWSNKDGFQLAHGMSAIGSSGWFGNGLNGLPLYFPESQTDFIFAVYASNFGFVGSIFLIALLTVFDIRLITIAMDKSNNIDKYIIAGIVGMLIYQQFQNIGMTFGLIPITGITLPFISYGGSSLMSYIITIGIILNISNKNKIKKRQFN